MAVDSIGFIEPGATINQLTTPGTMNGATDFGVWLNQSLQTVNQQILHADNQLELLATGDIQNLHQVMLDLEKAKTSFQLMLQVRNKTLEAYHEIMRMQI